MQSLLLDKTVSYLIEKGLLFFVLWALFTGIILKSPKVLELTLSPSDKSLVLIMAALLCILIHHLVVFLKARAWYYSSKSYSKDVYDAVREARSLITQVANPKTSLQALKDSTDSLRDLLPRVPEENENRADLLKVVSWLRSEARSRSNDPNHRGDIIEVLKPFRKGTEWVLRGKS